jgi:hypothetical protein
MTKDKKELKFKFVFPEDYNPTYANGIWGGALPNGEINITFFHERLPVPKASFHYIDDAGQVLPEHRRDPEEQVIVRFVTSGVTFNYNYAKVFHTWLGEQIKILENQFGFKK